MNRFESNNLSVQVGAETRGCQIRYKRPLIKYRELAFSIYFINIMEEVLNSNNDEAYRLESKMEKWLKL